MLSNVHLKNLALIREADIDYTKGLNIMTGETGSGKSIIISAISTGLGAKANKALIRQGAPYALIELLFTDIPKSAEKILSEMGFQAEDGQVCVSRKITPEAAISKINGETATLSKIKALTQLLIDIHGQHEHQSLMDPSKHLDIIDGFGGEKIFSVKEELSREHEHFKSMRREYLSFNMDEAALEREASLARFEAGEIDDAGLSEGEDARLEEEYKRMNAFRQIGEALEKAENYINGDSGGVLDGISRAAAQIAQARENNPEQKELASFADSLADLDSIAKDLSSDINRYLSQNSFDEEHFSNVHERLNLINKLKSKYGRETDDILNYREGLSEKLARLSNYGEEKQRLSEKIKESGARLNALARELSSLRKEAAETLKPVIIENLRDLNFLSAEFDIEFEKTQKISAGGYDRAQFMISTNPGEKLRPLQSTASGGELSRVMLAIKASLASADSIPTLIFDEIDNGISGLTAQRVSEKLSALSQRHQIICITHLPQIAAMGDSHFVIHKEVEGESTISGIERLGRGEETKEIARLLSGAQITEKTLENARELKEEAAKIKESRRPRTENH